ncbi:MAG TPA: hypothetical protein VFQ39_20490 [Longimicrobium sp.]|nr:hypothetical protein [Longimicrobium sp.]
MEKLKLSTDALKVTSFDLGDGDAAESIVKDAISGSRPTCRTCLTNITCCTPMI